MHFKYNIVNRNRGSDKRQVASDKLQSCGSRFPAVYMRRGGLPEGHGMLQIQIQPECLLNLVLQLRRKLPQVLPQAILADRTNLVRQDQ